MRQDYTADPIVTVTEITTRDAFSATKTNVRFCPSLLELLWQINRENA